MVVELCWGMQNLKFPWATCSSRSCQARTSTRAQGMPVQSERSQLRILNLSQRAVVGSLIRNSSRVQYGTHLQHHLVT